MERRADQQRYRQHQRADPVGGRERPRGHRRRSRRDVRRSDAAAQCLSAGQPRPAGAGLAWRGNGGFQGRALRGHEPLPAGRRIQGAPHHRRLGWRVLVQCQGRGAGGGHPRAGHRWQWLGQPRHRAVLCRRLQGRLGVLRQLQRLVQRLHRRDPGHCRGSALRGKKLRRADCVVRRCHQRPLLAERGLPIADAGQPRVDGLRRRQGPHRHRLRWRCDLDSSIPARRVIRLFQRRRQLSDCQRRQRRSAWQCLDHRRLGEAG